MATGTHPLRKPIILIGAPSGAGKTELSHRIIANGLPFFLDLQDGAAAPIVRHDLKVLPAELPRDQVIIIECATDKFERMQKRYWDKLAGFLQDCELVVHVNLDVAERVIIGQYFRRIFTGPRRLNVFQRAIRLSKYQRLFGYMLTGQLSRAAREWEALGRRLASGPAANVALVRARRAGDDYQFLLETGSPVYEMRDRGGHTGMARMVPTSS
jgi:hypothetical protein